MQNICKEMNDNFIDSLKNEIEMCTKGAAVLEPSIDVFNSWKDSVDEYAIDYLESLDAKTSYSYEKENFFQGMEFKEEPKPIENMIDVLKENYNDSGINIASGSFLGFIGSGGLAPSALADYIAAITNKHSGLLYTCPAAVYIENSIIRWACNLVGFPVESTGNICSGTSTGVLYSIHVARDAKRLKSQDFSKLVVYCTTVTHGCIFKALKVAGLSDSLVRIVKTDNRFRMLSNELENHIQDDLYSGLIPFLVYGNAGSTDLGSIDPLYDIGLIANKYKIWYHVDAAYGGFFTLVESEKHKFKGIELADSVTLDPHKTLFIAYGCGMVLYKNSISARKAFSVNCNCLQDHKSDEISPADVSLELSKHFRGLRIWLPLHLFGLKAFRSCLEEKILLTKYFYKSIQEIGYEVGPEPELSVTIFRYVPNNDKLDVNCVNEEILEMVKKEGTIFLSSTKIEGVYWIRCAIVSFRTHLKHIDNCLRVLKTCISDTENFKKLEGKSFGSTNGLCLLKR